MASSARTCRSLGCSAPSLVRRPTAISSVSRGACVVASPMKAPLLVQRSAEHRDVSLPEVSSDELGQICGRPARRGHVVGHADHEVSHDDVQHVRRVGGDGSREVLRGRRQDAVIEGARAQSAYGSVDLELDELDGVCSVPARGIAAASLRGPVGACAVPSTLPLPRRPAFPVVHAHALCPPSGLTQSSADGFRTGVGATAGDRGR